MRGISCILIDGLAVSIYRNGRSGYLTVFRFFTSRLYRPHKLTLLPAESNFDINRLPPTGKGNDTRRKGLRNGGKDVLECPTSVARSQT